MKKLTQTELDTAIAQLSEWKLVNDKLNKTLGLLFVIRTVPSITVQEKHHWQFLFRVTSFRQINSITVSFCAEFYFSFEKQRIFLRLNKATAEQNNKQN